MNLDASLQRRGARALQGSRTVPAARERVIADLTALGLVGKIEPHNLMVPRGDRTNAVLEPLLTDQWFRRHQAARGHLRSRAVEDGSIRFVPDNWSGVYFEWMRNIKDWCISRQLWWGHPHPGMVRPRGPLVRRPQRSRSTGRARPRARGDAAAGRGRARYLVLLGTLAFSTQGWPRETRALDTYYPTSVLVTGFDIHFLLGRAQ